LDNKVVLETKGISKHYFGVKALDNVDMQLYEKEIIAVVGDNGAGKTTLIKVISGVYKQDAGEIFVNGELAEINDPIDFEGVRYRDRVSGGRGHTDLERCIEFVPWKRKDT